MLSRTLRSLFLTSILVVSAAMPQFAAHAAEKNPSKFTFVVFGDNRPDSADKPLPDVFKQIVAEITVLHPAFVMTTGDLIYGSATDLALVDKEYDEALPLVRSMGVPIYFAAGNHEIRGKQANEDLYRKRVSKDLYYSFNYGNTHLIMLDSDVIGQEHKITGKQLAWLEQDLQRVQGKTQHIFAFMHQQPYPVSWHIGSSLDVYPEDRDKFQAVLKKYHVEALITGHEHIYDDSVHDGVRQIISGGAGAPLYPTIRGGSFYHYLVITIDGDKTLISVVKPGSVFSAETVLTVAPSLKQDPKKPEGDH